MAVTVSNLQNFIDGEFVASRRGATDPVINPATGEEIGQAAGSDAADVDRAVAGRDEGVRDLGAHHAGRPFAGAAEAGRRDRGERR